MALMCVYDEDYVRQVKWVFVTLLCFVFQRIFHKKISAEPAAYIPVINVPQGILTLSEGQYSLHKDHRSSNDAKNHPYTSALHFGFSVSLLSLLNANMNKVHLCCHTMLTWIGFNTFSIFWTANDHLPPVQHCGFDNFDSFAASGPHATTFSSSSCRCLRFHLIVVFVDVFTFISVSSSSWPSLSTPLPRRRLRLHPSRREFSVDRRLGIVLFCIVSVVCCLS
ncbi:Uncharacterized protein APZ42_018968 [Daphnia magna]|uniref:Uncharacterized protein n=1 Tax=Daphnia magna TaxID=35525 RepID=A0A162CQ77_9CRUS|nr:Uncharacterized protein APZ42_018968 [Daphnia magna]